MYTSRTTLQFYQLPPSHLKQAYCHDILLHARLEHTGACHLASCGKQSANLCDHHDATTNWTGIKLGSTVWESWTLVTAPRQSTKGKGQSL